MDKSENEQMSDLIAKLNDIGAWKFGRFTLKSGLVSPVYFDFRVIISHPSVLKLISELVAKEIEKNGNVDLVCGIAYTADPIATLVSIQTGLPMVLKRKEQKSYGTGKLVEGEFKAGDRVLIIEDVITSGSSIVETAACLRDHGLVVKDAIVLLDRGQGAVVHLEENGIRLVKSLLTLEMIFECCPSIPVAFQEEVHTFIKENQLFDRDFNGALASKLIPRLKSPIALKLVEIMKAKRSNLCLSVDMDTWEEALAVVDTVGDKVCIVKTHVDTLGLKGVKAITSFWETLRGLATKHNFLIMEDPKMADIGSTIVKQLRSKPFEMVKWADLVSFQAISGPGIFNAVEKVNKGSGKEIGMVLIAEMSSEGSIPTLLPGYKDLVYKMAATHPALIAGIVSQSQPLNKEEDSSYFLQMTSGVSLNAGGGDGLGQQYTSVEDAVLKRGADVIIVGRGITSGGKEAWEGLTEEFRVAAWAAFKTRVAAL